MMFKYFLYEIRGLLIIISVASLSSFLTRVGWDSFVVYAHSGIIPMISCGIVAGAYSFIILATAILYIKKSLQRAIITYNKISTK
jgi:nitrate reductase NapE component